MSNAASVAAAAAASRQAAQGLGAADERASWLMGCERVNKEPVSQSVSHSSTHSPTRGGDTMM